MRHDTDVHYKMTLLKPTNLLRIFQKLRRRRCLMTRLRNFELRDARQKKLFRRKSHDTRNLGSRQISAKRNGEDGKKKSISFFCVITSFRPIIIYGCRFYQTVQPLAPSIPNVLYHYNLRSPQSILHLRDDTLSQLLTMANVRPGGRYLVVDDTGGLITAAVLERMGSEGSILLFNESDSPPAWGILQTMNFSDRELEPIKWLNWLEAEEGYQKRE